MHKIQICTHTHTDNNMKMKDSDVKLRKQRVSLKSPRRLDVREQRRNKGQNLIFFFFLKSARRTPQAPR